MSLLTIPMFSAVMSKQWAFQMMSCKQVYGSPNTLVIMVPHLTSSSSCVSYFLWFHCFLYLHDSNNLHAFGTILCHYMREGCASFCTPVWKRQGKVLGKTCVSQKGWLVWYVRFWEVPNSFEVKNLWNSCAIQLDGMHPGRIFRDELSYKVVISS